MRWGGFQAAPKQSTYSLTKGSALMPAFVIQFPDENFMPARTLVNGVEAMVVFAATSADAIAFAKAQSGNDVDSMWDNADVTEVAAPDDLAGFTLRAQLFAPDSGGTPLVDESAFPVVDVSILVGDAEWEKAVGTLTGDTVATQVVLIGTTYYQFVDDSTPNAGNGTVGTPYLVDNLASDTDAFANLVKAINATGVAGTTYSTGLVAHATVEALTSDATTLTVRARTGGAAGGLIATTTGGDTDITWGATTLEGGQDLSTVDSVALAMAAALNATDEIAGASYDDSGNVLTVAETTDSLGDHTLVITLTPPGARDSDDEDGAPLSLPGFFGATVDGGSSGDAVTVEFGADDYDLPKFVAGFQQL